MISKLILAQQVTVQDRIIIQLYIHVEPVTIQLLGMIKELFVIHAISGITHTVNPWIQNIIYNTLKIQA
jgi:hypothetical protein